ncbi:kinase activity protein [[Candida] boidinii]|nr:kinase activity protein [[Candida] boidinii]
MSRDPGLISKSLKRLISSHGAYINSICTIPTTLNSNIQHGKNSTVKQPVKSINTINYSRSIHSTPRINRSTTEDVTSLYTSEVLTTPESIRRQHLLRSSLEHIIHQFASMPVPTITLNDLLKFNHRFKNSVNNKGNENSMEKTIDETKKMLLENANETLEDLLVLICRRLDEFMKLPYIILLNPNIAEIYETYLISLQKCFEYLNKIDPNLIYNNEIDTINIDGVKIENLEQNNDFINLLNDIMNLHTDNLPVLSQGFEEISAIGLIDDKKFLSNHLRERILMRLVSHHHIELSSQLNEMIKINNDSVLDNNIGIIEKNINVLEIVQKSLNFVNDMCNLKYCEKIDLKLRAVTINHDKSVNIINFENFNDYNPRLDDENNQLIFPYISTHLEYVFNELFKNSARAQIENHSKDPVEITLVVNKPSLDNHLKSTSKDEKSNCYHLEIRIIDKGKGIKPEIVDNLFDYSFTTFEDGLDNDNESYKTLNNTGDANIIAGMGYGLPLSRIYIELFDGKIDLHSIHGYGTTVYMKWNGPNVRLLQ